MAAATPTLDDLVLQLHQLLPICGRNVYGPCLEEAGPGGRGWAVFPAGEKVCTSDVLLPGFNMLPRWLLGAVYGLFLTYLFIGVAIASDLFMGGVITITSTTKKVKRRNQHGDIVIVEEPIWNWVVANITLMALGTSAPELMLALIEALLTLGKPAGELGPSCIVGSAAYNLLVISAVCTVAMPNGTFKGIKQLHVFYTTAAWSMFAYIWMLVVYLWWTPDEVTLAEALLTLLFFVLLVLTAWLVDTQPWKKRVYLSPPEASTALATAPASVPLVDMEKGGAKAPVTSVRSSAEEQAEKNAAFFRSVMEQRARMHNGRSRLMSKGPPSSSASDAEPGTPRSPLKGAQAAGSHDRVMPMGASPDKQHVMFRSAAYSFLESAGVVRVAVVRLPPAGGRLSGPLRVQYRTEDGDAVAGLDYEATQGVLLFGPDEGSKYIEIKIMDDNVSEPDVTFNVFITLLEPPFGGSSPDAIIVQDRVAVTIVDDDDAGLLGFELPQYEVGFNDGRLYAEVVVVRRSGADGVVEVSYSTEDGSAVAFQDYEACTGTLVFENGQKSEKLRIPLLAGGVPEAHKAFKVKLHSPKGAELSSRSTTRVTVVRRTLTLVSNAVDGLEGPNVHGSIKVRPDSSDESTAAASKGGARPYDLRAVWAAQIRSAFEVDIPEDGESKTWGGLLLHYSSITWRVLLYTLVPPADWKGGYPAFVCALGAVIGIVYLVNEAGSLFGCIVGLKDLMTGVSILAFGTSLPDTLASRIAAINDDTADSAIGNITGSNCVNVFLGLGLPWTISAIYYRIKGEKYVTKAPGLAFSVRLFLILGAAGIAILAISRRYGGELGGSKQRQYLVASTFVALWLLYLVLSGAEAYGDI